MNGAEFAAVVVAAAATNVNTAAAHINTFNSDPAGRREACMLGAALAVPLVLMAVMVELPRCRGRAAIVDVCR